MPDPSAELAIRDPRTEVARPGDVLPSDEEIRVMYRIAEALHLSGAYKDSSAEKAFAKMVVGRDLGLKPTVAMNGIHLVEGGVSMHYTTLGQFIRSREGYDFRAGWIKEVPATQSAPASQVFVWHDEEDPLDNREVVGAAVEFTVNGQRRGLSRFTIEDARKAQLVKDHAKSAWNAARRNMLLARAMSNGVKWFIPEVMGGLPVYAQGELEAAREPSDALTAPVGGGDDAGSGVDLGPDVEKIVARAQELGHAGLSNRAALEIALGSRAPGKVKEWVRAARAELDRFAREKDAAAAPTENAVEEPEQEVDAVPVTDDAAGPENDQEAPEVAGIDRSPQAHAGHAVALTRTEGKPDRLYCQTCKLDLDVPDHVEHVNAPPPAESIVDRIQATVEADGGTVEP